MKKEHPILFSTPMIRAILDGRKSQTRRIVKFPDFQQSTTKGYDWEFRDKKARWHSVRHERLLELCPYGKKGMTLWVRETWLRCPDGYVYRGDHFGGVILTSKGGKTFDEQVRWKPSIFMPKEACRIWLEITDIRVERVQNISEADAMAEGVLSLDPHLVCDACCTVRYMWLWDSVNGKGSWEKNPWVWVIEFKQINK